MNTTGDLSHLSPDDSWNDLQLPHDPDYNEVGIEN